MQAEDERQKNFFNICGTCKINCCWDAKPPITGRREKIILEYLRTQGIYLENPFVHAEYTFPREDANGYCIFYDKATRKCVVHPVKPETCVAGPVTFDINKTTGKIEWYLKIEKICPLAGVIYKDKALLKKHFEAARREILQLVRELTPEALRTILKREELDTFKIGEEELEGEVLRKL
ncbi:YkgJ family cysteine cluster protein [Candidatus Bathyarchaeota archaeon]|nr:YkgJ family cysteine cluster protein [Candidatus Bathyarchaeota archaeon]MBS7636253.1 YkgJ family cysteine cluster protein [Candidatus Bathyarchaeota archaeon]